MSLKGYQQAICLGIAILALLICNYFTVGLFSHPSEKNFVSEAPTVRYGSESDKTSDTSATTAVTTESTTETEAATVSSTDTTTVTTTASTTKPKKIRFLKGFKYSIVVYLKSQSVAVYTKKSDGKTVKQVKCFTCSSGDPSSPTPTGDFTLIGKYRWRSLEGDVFGQYCSRIHGHILFHSTPYLKENPSTLDNEEYDKLGSAVSHGCVRMCVSDCKWIYDNTPMGTPVSIVDEEGPAGKEPVSRKTDSAFNGWDPTDEWARGNPYFRK